MKKILPLALLLIFTAMYSFAQKTIIRNETADIAGGTYPASLVTLENTELEKVENAFSSYLKKQKDKQEKSDGLIFQDNAMVKDISPDTIDIYAAFKSSGKDVTIIMAVNRNGHFINNERGSARGVEALLSEFAVDFRKEQASEELEIVEKALNAMEKNHDKLVDSMEDLKKDNEEMKQKISDNEAVIKENQEKNFKEQSRAKYSTGISEIESSRIKKYRLIQLIRFLPNNCNHEISRNKNWTFQIG
ncbi:MAG: hypothetical protein IPG39_18635 [Bacteroidetes bacterium]|nr:hypothetical protein [Bacteroidota bacterium]